MTTTITVYALQDEKTSQRYVSVTTAPFSRLVGTMTSRFHQYKTTDDNEKKKLYHHACFPLLEKGATIVKLEEYECKPNDNIRNMKVQLMEKYTSQIDPAVLIKLKRPLKPEFERNLIDRRYRAKNKDNINEKQRYKYTCQICQGKHTRANRYNHQQTTKHKTAVLAQIARDENKRYPC
jgi:hypothetical protein